MAKEKEVRGRISGENMVDSPLVRLLGWFPWSVHTSSIVWDYIMKVRFDSQALSLY